MKILTSRTWICHAVNAVLAILFGVIYQLYPVSVDDLWYLCETVAPAGTLEALKQTWNYAVECTNSDTGRLGNLVVVPFLSYFPRWVYSTVSALCIWLILSLGARLAKQDRPSGCAAVWMAVVVFILPWYEYMFTMLYTVNYVWAAVVGLMFLTLFLRGNGDKLTVIRAIGLLMIGFLMGWWHEGFSVPMVCGLVVWAMIVRTHVITGQRVTMAIGLLIGFICRISMPAFWRMPAVRESHVIKSVWLETVINVVAFDCMFYLLAIALILVMMLPGLRRRWSAMKRDDRAFVMFALTFGVVSTVIYLRYFNGARTGFSASWCVRLDCCV